MLVIDTLLVIYVYTIYSNFKLISIYIYTILSTQYILQKQNINVYWDSDKKDNAVHKHIVEENK